MRRVRQVVHVLAWVATLAVALLTLALIVSQTPWFRDYLRRVIVREAKQYLDGELTVGRLSGNLFFGITMFDVAVDISGDRAIAIKSLQVDYSVFQLVSRGIIIDRLAITEPSVHLARDRRGWNLGRLVKRQEREANREGPRRSITLPSITIVNGSLVVDDQVGSTAYRIPRRIDALDVQAGFAYEPVHYSIVLEKLGFRAADPALDAQQLTGKVAVRDDNLYLDGMTLKTGETSLAFKGVIEQYLRRPMLKIETEGHASLPEIGGILLAVSGYELHPDLRVKTDGPIDALAMDLDIKAEIGLVRGQVTADFQTPDLRFAGPLHVERLNLGPIFKNPKQRSDITGDTKFDVTIRSAPAGAPALDRLKGTFVFRGPRVQAFGYDATAVDAAGTIEGPRVALSHARANAYAASATTRGVIVLPQGTRAIAYDLQGSADHVDMRRLPAMVRAPRLETNITLSEYDVKGSGSSASGTGTMKPSTVEGAAIADATRVSFDVAPRRFSYTAQGAVSNLNLPRLGRVLKVPALDKPIYDGRVNGAFDVKGSGTTLATMTLDASGTLRSSTLGGMELPELSFASRIADQALTVRAKGGFEHLNPAVLTDRKVLDGNVSGVLDGTFRVPDLSTTFTKASFGVEGSLTLAPSLVGGVQIAGANIVGQYDKEVADLTRFQIKGPDVMLDASGRLALDRTSDSNVTFHVDAGNLSEVGRIAGQRDVEGAALIDGTITGNAAALKTTGTLKGIGLGWNGNRALGATSKFSATVPEFDFPNAKVEATTTAEFVQLASVELNHVSATTTYAKQQLEFSTTFRQETREIEASGDVVFHPDHQEIHLPKLALRTDGIEWRTSSGEAAIQYRSGEIDIDNVTLTSTDQSLTVSGKLSTGSEARAVTGTLKIDAKNVDLAQAERLLLLERGLGGRLTANAVVSGTTAQPIVDGHVEVTDGKFQGYAYQSLVADVDYTDRKIVLDATLQQSPGVAITAKGSVPTTAFAGDGHGAHVEPTAADLIDLRIQTPSLNLGVVQGATTAVTNVAGTMQADVHITGSGRDPHLEGFVEIRDGAFAVPRAGTSYTGLDTRIDLDKDVVRIRQFEILDENGEQMTVAGQLAVHERQVGAVDVTLESQNFEAIDNELGDVGVGTRLKITGTLLRPRLEGELRIATGRLEVDRILRLFYDPYRTNVLPEVVSAERAAQSTAGAADATRKALDQAAQGTRQAAAAAQQPYFDEDFYGAAPRTMFDNVALEVHVRIPDNLVVRGRKLRPGGPTGAALGDMNITLGGDLMVRKNYDQPLTIAGTVNTVRGTYQFQGRQFEIARDGTLRFTGEPTNPIIDVTAVRRIPETGVEARVHITGNLSAPDLQLSSVPPLDESDVLSLIVFNRPINELGTGERASLAATAGGIATGFIATPLGESIGRALDLDVFEITTTAEGDSIGAGVTAGKQIGDRTFFKLRQQFGERTYSEFLLEYQIADFLRVTASGAPEASGAANRIGLRRIERAGIDLIFFFSY